MKTPNKPFLKFRWHKEWYDYSETINNKSVQNAFKWAIIAYGLDCQEPTDLQGEVLRYFNESVRPELDKQHKKFSKNK